MKRMLGSYEISFILGISIGMIIMFAIMVPKCGIKYQQIKPSNCVSAKEYKLRFESYEMYLDSLAWSGQRKDKTRTKRLQDSVTSKLNKLYF